MFIKGLLPLQSLRLKPKGAFSVGTFGSSVGSTYIHIFVQVEMIENSERSYHDNLLGMIKNCIGAPDFLKYGFYKKSLRFSKWPDRSNITDFL